MLRGTWRRLGEDWGEEWDVEASPARAVPPPPPPNYHHNRLYNKLKMGESRIYKTQVFSLQYKHVGWGGVFKSWELLILTTRTTIRNHKKNTLILTIHPYMVVFWNNQSEQWIKLINLTLYLELLKEMVSVDGISFWLANFTHFLLSNYIERVWSVCPVCPFSIFYIPHILYGWFMKDLARKILVFLVNATPTI